MRTGGVNDDNTHPVFGCQFNMRVVKAFRSMQGSARVFTMDSFATESFTFCEDLLEDCTDDETIVQGIHGSGKVGRRGVLPGLGPAIVAPAGGINGISLSQMELRFRVVYTQRVSFRVVVAEDFELVFKHNASSGCYSCVFTDVIIKRLKEIASRSSYILVSTVSERVARYTN